MGVNGCFSCGKQFKGDTNAYLRHLKEIYNKTGREYFFYRLGVNKPVMIASKESFWKTYETKIQPILNKEGVEYASIQEYTGI